MKMKQTIICLLSIVLFVCLTDLVYATLNINWQPDSPIYAGQTDTVEVFGTLYNDISSTEVLDLTTLIGNGGGAGTTCGSLIYSSVYAPVNPYDYEPNATYHPEFNSLILNPGDNYQFLYATLTPVDPPVDIGIYQSSMSINFNTQQYGFLNLGYKPVVVNVVPEPMSFILLLTGIAGLACESYLRKKHLIK